MKQKGRRGVWNLSKNKIKILIYSLCSIGFVGLAIALSKSLLGADWKPFFSWWLTLLLLGISFYPLTSLIFKRFEDGGYLFSKTIALAISGWLLWVFSSLHILKFTKVSCYIIVIICAICNYGVAFYQYKKRKTTSSIASKTENVLLKRIPWILFLELFFFLLFLFFTYLKCFNPEANGTEKFMDYGFMTSMMRAEYMPPEDFWFSGTSLNYYYMGQYYAVFLTKLANTTVNYGYNLALMMTAAFCFTFVYALVCQIFTFCLKEKQGYTNKPLKGLSWLPHITGFVSACAVTFASSCHYFVFYRIVPIIWDILELEGDAPSYWFPDATRYIGYHPETDDKTIHEFPSYSFILGDLHAHVINIMFVLTLLAILFAWLWNRKERMHDTGKKFVDIKQEMLNPAVLLLGFFIGIFHMTNFWDFPIYYVVTGAVILSSNAIFCNFKKQTITLTAWHAVVILGIAELTSALFTLRFDSMAGGIALATKHTPLYQLIILWGLPIVLVFCYLVSLITKQREATLKNVDAMCSLEGVSKEDKQKSKKPAFFVFLEQLSVIDLFLLILGLCAAGLVWIPEVIYVIDIYGGSYARANTMFKLTYQAFILFGIITGPLIIRFICFSKKLKPCLWGIVALLLVLSNTEYFFTSSETWFGDITKKENFDGLDAAAFIDTLLPADAKAIDWLNENVEGVQVVVEAPGDSYTNYERISVLTGLPTIVGWHTHEWLWKDDVEAVNARGEDVKTIYTCQNTAVALQMLEKYDADYLYVGKLEQEKYTELNYEWLKSLGEVVFEVEDDTYYETFIVKLK